MPNTSIHLSRCNILQNNKLQPAEVYKESQQTAKLEIFCDEFLKISQSRYGLSTSADSIANLLAFFTKASDAIDSIKTQKIDVHSYGFVPIRHFVEHVITYKNEFAADYEPYTLTFTRGENNEGILSVESKEGFISQRTINLNEYEAAINIINEHVAKENRRTQAKFECVKCRYVANADFNAARNILAAGHAVLSAEGGCSKGRPLKQKTCDGREKVA